METHTSPKTLEHIVKEYATPLSIVAAGLFISLSVLYGSPDQRAAVAVGSEAELAESVLPTDGVELPVTWGDLGAKLVEAGAIDPTKLEALYEARGGFPAEYARMLEENADENIVITNWNAGYLLNLLWALGLANTNPILADKAEMMNPAYNGAGSFASTGGWTLARGSAMDHYGMHALIVLSADEQSLVDRISRNIFRPCCGNSTHFPDCNHGMAMLGLLELMASQGVGEQDMYEAALAANSFWFPETYLTIAAYMQQKGIAWKDVSPKEMLSAAYSSSSGYKDISSQVTKLPEAGKGGGCSA